MEQHVCECGSPATVMHLERVGGGDLIQWWECLECLSKRWEESSHAVDLLKQKKAEVVM